MTWSNNNINTIFLTCKAFFVGDVSMSVNL